MEARSVLPVLKDPANINRTSALTPKQFHYAFTNTRDEDASQAAYDRYAAPTPARILFQGGFGPLSAKLVQNGTLKTIPASRTECLPPKPPPSTPTCSPGYSPDRPKTSHGDCAHIRFWTLPAASGSSASMYATDHQKLGAVRTGCGTVLAGQDKTPDEGSSPSSVVRRGHDAARPSLSLSRCRGSW